MTPEERIASLNRLRQSEQGQYDAMRAALDARLAAIAADADVRERWLVEDQIVMLERRHEDVMCRIEADLVAMGGR